MLSLYHSCYLFVVCGLCYRSNIFPTKHVSEVYCFQNQKENRKHLIIFAIRSKHQVKTDVDHWPPFDLKPTSEVWSFKVEKIKKV